MRSYHAAFTKQIASRQLTEVPFERLKIFFQIAHYRVLILYQFIKKTVKVYLENRL